jgi:hypothetical protein
MVSKLGLFSSNETKEDVSTANLKYLLVRHPVSPPSLALAAASGFHAHFMSDLRLRRLVSSGAVLPR